MVTRIARQLLVLLAFLGVAIGFANLSTGGYKGHGWLAPLSQSLIWLLTQLQALTGTWGVAIILLAATLRLALFPIDLARHRIAAKALAIQTRVQEIHRTCADDTTARAAALIELFKTQGATLLTPFLFLAIELSLFVGLAMALRLSPGLHGQAFLWLDDLSAPDPLRLLPLVGLLAILAAIRANAAQMERAQRIATVVFVCLTSLLAMRLPSALNLVIATYALLGAVLQRRIQRASG